MNYQLKKKIFPFYHALSSLVEPISKFIYMNRRIPHTIGYIPFKWQLIDESINDTRLLSEFKRKIIPPSFGIGIDERCVEYVWLFANLKKESYEILDAGSTFNFKQLVNHSYFTNKKLHIYTFYPEFINFKRENVIYDYGDLRNMVYENDSFDQLISQSTIEHIDMDNSIYGYELSKNEDCSKKSFEYLKAISEYIRVVKPKGQILLTFPYGKFENHGFFQQFDNEMVEKIRELLYGLGTLEIEYIRYTSYGWKFAPVSECNDLISYNPHTGMGFGKDGAAHSRCVCCIKWVKN